MDEGHTEHLSIGEFARSSEIGIKALRLYHDLGLLPPAFVDPHTNYRYYSPEQLSYAYLIRLLRQMDMPLEQIKAGLGAASTDRSRLLLLVQQHLDARHARLRGAQQAARELNQFLNSGMNLAFEVSSLTLPIQLVLSSHGHVKMDQLDNFVETRITSMKLRISAEGINVVTAPIGIYHGPVNEEEDGPLQIAIPIEHPLNDPGANMHVDLAGGEFASSETRGEDCGFPRILGAYDAVSNWVTSRGYSLVSSPREVWHQRSGKDARVQILWQYKPGKS
ncbi:MAG: helix-turn-helix domain-containing protein [Anaerolineales bacterium]